MKKLYSTLLAVGTIALLHGQSTVTTVASGNATDLLIWDCQCLPADGDSIIINHDLILDVDFAITSGAIVVNATGSITGNVNNRILAISGGGFSNAGAVTLAYMYHSAGSFVNSNTMSITRNFGSDIFAQTVNNGVFAVNDTLLINTNAGFTSTGTIACPEIGNAGALINSGSITCDNLANSGVMNNNSGSITVGMTLLNIGTITNNAPLIITNDLYNAENVINSNFISCDNLYNGDTVAQTAVFTNNGTVSVAGDFINSRIVDGTGHFCVALVSTNAGAINGTLDFCDLSGGSIDLNVGTVASGVTYCSTSCSIGVSEVSAQSVKIYPNPVSDQLTIQLPGVAGTVVSITNSLGQTVFSETVGAQALSISVADYATGVYSVLVAQGDAVMTSRFVKQ